MTCGSVIPSAFAVFMLTASQVAIAAKQRIVSRQPILASATAKLGAQIAAETD
jgi:hypothetical protein